MAKLSTSVSQKPFTTSEIKRILEVLKQKDEWYHRYFLFALQTGMRRSEILALTWHDIDIWKHREITVLSPQNEQSSNARGRKIKIDKLLLSILLDSRSPSRWVFQKSGRRMLGGTVTRFFTELSRSLNTPITSEKIRWTYAYRMYQKISPQNAKDWKKLQKMIGHKELSSTKSYFQRNQYFAKQEQVL